MTPALGLAALCGGISPAARAEEPAIVPQVDTREVAVPHIASRDIELGAFLGTYATQNFGTSQVKGLRLGYALTEDFFVQANYGQTHVSDENFRQILPGGLFEQPKETLSYYDFTVGYNILPGEVFIGGRHARPSALYLIAGVGSTHFVDRSHQTISYGAGFRAYLADWVGVQIDARNHSFSMDLLGKQQSTHNIEFTAGVTFIF